MTPNEKMEKKKSSAKPATAKASSEKRPRKAAAPKTEVTASAASSAEVARKTKRIVQGVVVSDKMTKTIVVKAIRRLQHGNYFKYVTVAKKYKAHDEKQEAKLGDRVEIIESKPISRDKRWALRKILDRAALGANTTV